MYTKSVFTTGRNMRSDDARAKTARLAELGGFSPEDCEAIFHYRGGVAKDGFSPVKFLESARGFTLIGLGNEGSATIERVAEPLARAWSLSGGAHVACETTSGECAIEDSEPREYLIRRLCIQKKPRHLDQFAADPVKHVTELIARGIRAQADFLGLKCRDDLACSVVGARRDSPVSLGHGTAKLASLSDVRLFVNAELVGPWMVGYLTGKGLGLIESVGERHVRQ